MEGQFAMTQTSFSVSSSGNLARGPGLFDFDVRGVEDIADTFKIYELGLEGY